MKESRKTISGVNAGSMADIAFLLLIFFLVTTTFPEDQGIENYMPKPCPKGIDCNTELNERNIFSIKLNKNNELMANNELITVDKLRASIKAFVDNNGDKTCEYCHGTKDKTLSDNPKMAVITLHTAREASYDNYIEVQNELVGAYYDLRKSLSKMKFHKDVAYLTEDEVRALQEAYPFRITEADLK